MGCDIPALARCRQWVTLDCKCCYDATGWFHELEVGCGRRVAYDETCKPETSVSALMGAAVADATATCWGMCASSPFPAEQDANHVQGLVLRLAGAGRGSRCRWLRSQTWR